MDLPKPPPPSGKKITTRANGNIRVQTMNHEPTLTQQQFIEDCDVNNIMRKFKKTGVVTHINSKTGVYGDFTELGDYQEMLNTVAHANEMFEQLPNSVRRKFEHNPQEMIDFLKDPKNHDEAVQLGLMEPVKRTDSELQLDELKTLNKKISAPKKSPPLED